MNPINSSLPFKSFSNKIILYENDVKNPYLENNSIKLSNNNSNNDFNLSSKAYAVITSYFESISKNKNNQEVSLRNEDNYRTKVKKSQYIISNITCIRNVNEVTLQFFYYQSNSRFRPSSFAAKNFRNSYINTSNNTDNSIINKSSIINNLLIILEKIYGCRVHIVANRVHYPYINADILAKYLGKNANRNNFIHMWKSIVNNPVLNANLLNTFIIGIKITVRGRLTTERVIPRKTSKSVVIGTFSPKNIPKNLKVNIDRGLVHLKNKTGAFTITSEICNIIKTTAPKIKIKNFPCNFQY